MNENNEKQEVRARKRRSSEEVKRLVSSRNICECELIVQK